MSSSGKGSAPEKRPARTPLLAAPTVSRFAKPGFAILPLKGGDGSLWLTPATLAARRRSGEGRKPLGRSASKGSAAWTAASAGVTREAGDALHCRRRSALDDGPLRPLTLSLSPKGGEGTNAAGAVPFQMQLPCPQPGCAGRRPLHSFSLKHISIVPRCARWDDSPAQSPVLLES